jgi:hypothetical protein
LVGIRQNALKALSTFWLLGVVWEYFSVLALFLRPSRKFANDEVKTRVEKRLEMLGLEETFLLVIHDQSEALVCSVRLVVMHRG